MTRRGACLSLACAALLAEVGCGFDEPVLSSAAPGLPAAGAGSGGAAQGGAGGAIAGAGGAIAGGNAGGGAAGATVGPLTPGTTLSAGQSHTCAARSGALYCWGSNAHGELGLGDQAGRSAPALVPGLPPVADLSAGASWTLARVAQDGTLRSWGSNSHGQLGLGDLGDRPAPASVLAPGARAFSAGYEHACAVDPSGSLLCWGRNDEGQLGQSDPLPGKDSLSPVAVGLASDWSAVSGGMGHTCGLRAGSLWCWGRNTGAQLGLGSTSPQQLRSPAQLGAGASWESLDAGQDQACALRPDRSLWCWGAADSVGQMSGLLLAPTLIDLGGVIEISVDAFVSCAIRQDGSLWCVGRNAEGQLGLGDINPRSSFTRVGADSDWIHVSVGRFHTCAQKSDGRVFCAGENADGQLGVGDLDRRGVLTLALP
jgi:alpha-tubulin suppressor-like RCC1 family protein